MFKIFQGTQHSSAGKEEIATWSVITNFDGHSWYIGIFHNRDLILSSLPWGLIGTAILLRHFKNEGEK